MAKGRGGAARRSQRPRGHGAGAKPGAKGAGAGAKKNVAARRVDAAPAAPSAPAGPFRLGVVPGTTPGRWVDRWHERRPNALELVPLAVADQRAALDAGDVDAALVRLPIDREGLHVIALYDEVTVVVVSADSHLTAAEELDAADLSGEVVIVPRDDVLALPLPDWAVTPVFDAPQTTGDAIETVATGVGVVIVPMSLARLHHRRDTEYRPLRAAPASTIALAWPADATTPDVDTFVGIVRGRTANSSR